MGEHPRRWQDLGKRGRKEVPKSRVDDEMAEGRRERGWGSRAAATQGQGFDKRESKELSRNGLETTLMRAGVTWEEGVACLDRPAGEVGTVLMRGEGQCGCRQGRC